MSERPGVMFYWDMFDVFETLLDGEAKTMLIAIRNYSQYSETPDFGDNRLLATLWVLIRQKMDADAEKYRDTCAKRAEAGKKSAGQRAKLKELMKANANICSHLSTSDDKLNQKQIEIQKQQQRELQSQKEQEFDIKKEFSRWTV